MALARLGGSGASIRPASIRATSAFSGRPSAAAASRSASQNTGSRMIELAWPAIMIERFTGPKPVIARSRRRRGNPVLDCFAALAMTEKRARPSIHVLAAVDRQRRAGDEAAVLGAEEGDSAGDLVGAAQTADRDSRDDFLEHLGRDRRDHLGVDIAGRDRVDGDSGAGALLGERLGEAVDARFGGGVIDLAILAGLAVDRADVDDPAVFALAHPVPDRLGHVEAAAQIYVDDLVPGLAVHPLHGCVASDSGIVDEDVDRPQLGFDPGDSGDAGIVVGDVPFIGPDAGAGGEVACFLLVAGIIGGDGDSPVPERDADRLADAAGAAGDDCYACHDPLLLSCFCSGLIDRVANLQARAPAALEPWSCRSRRR